MKQKENSWKPRLKNEITNVWKYNYERRKAEGFPEPLYESWISIFEYYEYYDEQFQARKEQEERQKRRNKRNNKYK